MVLTVSFILGNHGGLRLNFVDFDTVVQPSCHIDVLRKAGNQLVEVALLSRLNGASSATNVFCPHFFFRHLSKKCGQIVMVNVCVFAKSKMIG